jgi:hypothetical protein
MAYRPSLLLLTFLYSFMGYSYYGVQDFSKANNEIKALVFLSSVCPCSQSHIEHLHDLQKAYPNLKIFGVMTDHYDKDSRGRVDQYYKASKMKIPIIKDVEQRLIKEYKALKTPHVVLLKRNTAGDYEILYEGGVSNHRKFSRSKKKFLQENLMALKNKEPLPYQHGKSLGCYIRRL